MTRVKPLARGSCGTKRRLFPSWERPISLPCASSPAEHWLIFGPFTDVRRGIDGLVHPNGSRRVGQPC